jgi:hypothetical protein
MVDISDRYAIRFFTGGMPPAAGMWFFDFFDKPHGSPINSGRLRCTVSIVGPKALAGPIESVEQILTEQPAQEGVERFAVIERFECCLERHGYPPFLFIVPHRQPGPVFQTATRIA